MPASTQAPDAGLPAWPPRCEDRGVTVHWRLLSDGSMAYPPEFIFPRQPPDELAHAGVGDEIVTPYNCLLIEAAGQIVLVDTGADPTGPLSATAGRLPGSLADAGFQPEDIDIVVLTHAHADHIGGLAQNGRPVFGRARHYLAPAEWAFWMSDDTRARLPEPLADLLISTARGALSAITDAGLLEQVEPPITLVPGVTLLPAPGHTPGHLAVEVAGADPPLLYLADALLHELQFEHVEWTSLVDVDPATAVETRRALLERASDGDILIAGFHLASTGHVARHGDSYRFTTSAAVTTESR
jgi:glyoxylase-like metal-dependent hydrolase (beta-lactamase superfamily II)